MSLSGTLRALIDMTETKALDLSTVQDPVSIDSDALFTFTDGTGALGVQVAWHDTITLAYEGNEEIGLVGSKTNAFGETVSFTQVKGIYLKNNSSDATLIVGHSAATAFPLTETAGDGVLIKPGGIALFIAPDADGYPVDEEGAGTSDLLKIEHDGQGSSTMDVDIYIAGEGSAA